MVLYEPTTSPVATAEATKKVAQWRDYGWSAPTRFNNAVVKSDVADFWGTVYDYATDLPIVGAHVGLDVVIGAVRTRLAEAYTDVSGKVTFSGINLPGVVGSADYILMFFETDIYYGTTTFVTVMIESRVPILSLSMPASGMPGASVTWSGKMTDPKVITYGIANKDIYLQQSTDGVTWPPNGVAGPIKTGADGSYSGSYTLPTTPGMYYYRSRFPGGSPGAQHGVAVSKVVAVRVLAPEEAPPPEYAPPPIFPPIFPFLPPREAPPEEVPPGEYTLGVIALGFPLPAPLPAEVMVAGEKLTIPLSKTLPTGPYTLSATFMEQTLECKIALDSPKLVAFIFDPLKVMSRALELPLLLPPIPLPKG